MTVVDLETVRAQVEILRFVKRKRAELKELEEHARAAVEAVMGDAGDGLLDGEPAIAWHTHKRRALDQKALRQDHPEIVEDYTTTTAVRRFEIIDDE